MAGPWGTVTTPGDGYRETAFADGTATSTTTWANFTSKPEQVKTYSLFFAGRFFKDVAHVDDLTDDVCLGRRASGHYVSYRESVDSIYLELSEMTGVQRAVAGPGLNA